MRAPFLIGAQLGLVDGHGDGCDRQVVGQTYNGDIIGNQVLLLCQIDESADERDDNLRRNFGIFAGYIAFDHRSHKRDILKGGCHGVGQTLHLLLQAVEQTLDLLRVVDILFRLAYAAVDDAARPFGAELLCHDALPSCSVSASIMIAFSIRVRL